MRSLLCCVGVLSLVATLPAQFQVGVDINAPINTTTGAIAAQVAPPTIATLGLDRVRVNCILGPWNSPGDTALHSGKTWFQTYDQIVDGFVAQGIEVYMLIGAEAVKSSVGNNLNSTTYVSEYAANFAAIVGHFKDRVRVYESFNEPNDWAGGTSAQVEPRYFALMLQEIYLGVKYSGGHWGDPTWQVTLVSGPLFTHDLDTGGPYWTQTCNAGINGDAAIPSLDWGNVQTLTGSYPYDGIGMHLYVAQGSTNPATVTAGINTNLNALWSAVTAREGAGTPKRIWISEVGWRDDYVGSAEGQALNVDTALGLLRADSRVRLGTWFCLVNFGPAYGVYTGAPLTSAGRKPSWWHLRWQALVGNGAGNIASNPGFETSDLTGWTSWGQVSGVQTGPWFASITPHAGTHFLGTATNFGQQSGGVWQQFSASPGETITAGAWVQTYREGGSSGDTTCRIGIDPAGGANPAAPGIVWSEWLEAQGAWRPLVIQATAGSSQVTIFLEHHQAAPTWNINCFDDVVVLGATALPAGVAMLGAD